MTGHLYVYVSVCLFSKYPKHYLVSFTLKFSLSLLSLSLSLSHTFCLPLSLPLFLTYAHTPTEKYRLTPRRVHIKYMCAIFAADCDHWTQRHHHPHWSSFCLFMPA